MSSDLVAVNEVWSDVPTVSSQDGPDRVVSISTDPMQVQPSAARSISLRVKNSVGTLILKVYEGTHSAWIHRPAWSFLARHSSALLLLALAACGTPDSRSDEVTLTTSLNDSIVLDAHAHIITPALQDALGQGGGGGPPTSADAFVSDFLGVSGSAQAQILSSAYMWGSTALSDSGYDASPEELQNVQMENDFVAGLAIDYPGILIPFCGVNPKKDYAISEIDRCVDELGMVGLKLHFSNSEVDLTDSEQLGWVQDVIAHTSSRALPVVLHFADLGTICPQGEDPSADDQVATATEAMSIFLDDVLKPNAVGLHLTFAHLTGAGNFPEWTQETFGLLVEAQPSLDAADLWVDVSAVFDSDDLGTCSPGVTDDDLARMGELLETWGVDRVLWGSDINDDYVEPTQNMWPLDAADYNTMAENDASGFRSGGD